MILDKLVEAIKDAAMLTPEGVRMVVQLPREVIQQMTKDSSMRDISTWFDINTPYGTIHIRTLEEK